MFRNRPFAAAAVILLSGLALISGCASSSKAFWGDPENGLILVYVLDKNPLTYETTSDQTQNLELMGQSMQNVTNSSAIVTVTPKGKKDAGYQVDVKIDDMQLDLKTFQGPIKPDLSNLKGKGFEMTVSPRGEESNFAGTEDLVYKLSGAGERNAATGLKTLFPDMAEKPVRIGDSWDSTEEIKENEGGMDILIKLTSKNTLKGLETVDGEECAVIAVKTTGTLEGTGQQAGMDLTFEGDITAEGSMYFAYKKGMLVKMESDGFTEGTIVTSGAQSFTIPMTQEMKSGMKLVK